MGGGRLEITPGSDLRSGVFVTSPKDESVETSESASLGPRKPYPGVPFCSAGCVPPSCQDPQEYPPHALLPWRLGSRTCPGLHTCLPLPCHLARTRTRITSLFNIMVLRIMTVLTTATTVRRPLTMTECAVYGLVKPSTSPNSSSLHGRGHTACLTELTHRSLPEVTVRSRQ